MSTQAMAVPLAARRLESLAGQRFTGRVSAGTEPGSIKGTAVRYNVDVDRGWGLFLRLLPGAFSDQVRDPSRVKVLWQHDTSDPIGAVQSLADHPDRLDYAGRISTSEKVPSAARALELLRDEIVEEVSVGFDILKFTREIDKEADTVTYLVSKAMLAELSVVTFGAMGPGATVQEVHSAAGRSAQVLEARRIRAELARLRA